MPSVNELQQKHTRKPEKTFTLDGKFLRDEAREALRSYFMPFAGLYAAAVGKEVRVVSANDTKPRTVHAKRAATSGRHASAKRK